MNGTGEYSAVKETRAHFNTCAREQPISPGLRAQVFQEYASKVQFQASQDTVFFPCPFQQTEAVSVLKAIEACWAACIADLRYGARERQIIVTLERSARYLLGSYLFSIDGLGKLDPGVKTKLKGPSSGRIDFNLAPIDKDCNI